MGFFVVTVMCATFVGETTSLCGAPQTFQAKEYPTLAACNAIADVHRHGVRDRLKAGSVVSGSTVATATHDVQCLSTRDTILKLEEAVRAEIRRQ